MESVTPAVPINTAALVAQIEAHTAQQCQLEPWWQGSHHMVYVATLLPSSERYIVRIDAPCFRPYGSGLTPPSKMRSEIATLKYVREHSSVPVPDVTYHHLDDDGEVGGEWMMMEYIPGVPLMEQWPSMTREQRQEICVKIARIWGQLMSMRFPSVGSLYEAPLSGPVDNSVIVGPTTFYPSAKANRTAPPDPSRCGPFTSLKEWLLAIARRDMAFGDPQPLSEEHRARVAAVVADIEAAPPALFSSAPGSAIVLEHIDLLPHNVLVRPDAPTDVLAIIDWEGARTVPLWAVQPMFLEQDLEEYEEHIALIKRTLSELVPAWADAQNGDECREARRLYLRARLSIFDPATFHPDEIIWSFNPN
ncbi:kinase-like domain-containing protein [Schizophyllum amplum]|uniref:Kinase-like domain-containing protein n=1 Tax=Schizophyllum amplum TaxID=97359 RepID=A0A550CQD2_9AGAR|nr:kinase-like domain-containing protein [Auriculariopsis ampla]